MTMQVLYWLLFFVVVVLPSLTIHEYAHARASVRLGDITPKLQDRLTLNPFAHIDPVGTIALPLLLTLMGAGVIGRARPVPINPYAYRKPIRDEFIVAMAWPLSNILLGIVLTMVAVILSMIWDGLSYSAVSLVWALSWIKMAAIVNFSLALFNLIPLPPLDGYRIITLIAPQTKMRMLQYQQYIMIGIMVVMISPLGGRIASGIFRIAQRFFWILVAWATSLR